MRKEQLIVVASALALFLVLYFGCDVTSRQQQKETQNQALKAEAVDIDGLVKEALKMLSPEERATAEGLLAADKARDVAALKQISGLFHDHKAEVAAAHFAEKVAEVENTEGAWSVAGANFYLALTQSTDKNVRDFCTKHAVSAFQNAISLNPSVLDHRINLALCYTENPPQDNPMQGILLLRDLDQQNPENVAVNYQLARMAVRTGQWDRAAGRLETIFKKEPNNRRAACLAVEVYQGLGDAKKAAIFAQKCGQ